MDRAEGTQSLNAILNKYPDSYQQGLEPTIVITNNDEYGIVVALAMHPYSSEHVVLVLELAFQSLPFFSYNFSTKRAIKAVNKKIASKKGFEVQIGERNGKFQCLIHKIYYGPIDLEELERDQAEISVLAMLVFTALKETIT